MIRLLVLLWEKLTCTKHKHILETEILNWIFEEQVSHTLHKCITCKKYLVASHFFRPEEYWEIEEYISIVKEHGGVNRYDLAELIKLGKAKIEAEYYYKNNRN